MRPMKFLIILLAASTLLSCTRAELAISTPTPTQSVMDLMEMAWEDRGYHEQAWLENSYEPAVDLSKATRYHMAINIEDDFRTVSGRQRILYTNNEAQALDEIYLRLFPNLAGGEGEISSAAIDGRSIEPIYESQGSAVKLTLVDALLPGNSFEIEIEFSTSIPRQMEGNYGLFGYFEGFLVLDTFYPMIPVYDQDGWHKEATPPNGDPTYNDISFYLVQVRAPAELDLLATGSEVERLERGDDQIVTFASGPARDFYLAAAEELEMLQEQVGDTLVRSYAPADFRAHAELVLEVGVDALQSFETRFGAYPYPEMELIGTPMRALGIEYPGIMGMNLDMYDPDASIGGLPAHVYLESTVVHEIAHQWFYNLVGNDQAQEPWLDEALAQYATYLYYLDTEGAGAASAFERSWYDRWDRTNRADIPIGLPAGEYERAEYGSIVYGRGPIFMIELSQRMGQEDMNAFLRQYVQQHAWDIAAEDDFESSAEAACDCDLEELFDEWVR